jgi:hypothetical protein
MSLHAEPWPLRFSLASASFYIVPVDPLIPSYPGWRCDADLSSPFSLFVRFLRTALLS